MTDYRMMMWVGIFSGLAILFGIIGWRDSPRVQQDGDDIRDMVELLNKGSTR